jgi:mono/diheme cytochrome c family protein
MKKMMLMVLLGVAAQAGAQTLDGKSLFAKNCAACHQASGAGIPGAFPALKGNSFVLGDSGAVISTVLKGRGGMPTFATSIDDEKLALVLSYIRQSWGNQAAPVSAQQVQSARSASGAGEAVRQEQPTNVH